jgi:hypothetical protein
MSSKFDPTATQAQAEGETFDNNAPSVAAGDNVVGPQDVDPEAPQRGKASLMTDAEGIAKDGSIRGVHGLPFSSVRSTKTTVHLGHAKNRES